MHLDRVRASAANLSRNPHFIQEKVEGCFSPEIHKSFLTLLPKDLYFQPMGLQYSQVSENYFTGLHDHTEDQSPQVFDGVEFESELHFAEFLLVSSKPIEIDILANSLTSVGFRQKQSWRSFYRRQVRIRSPLASDLRELAEHLQKAS